MGGKKKGAVTQPRTKDNLKPSSSEKAAQFLINQTGGLGLPTSLLQTDLMGTILQPATSTTPAESIIPSKVAGLVPVPQDPDASALEPCLLSSLKRLEKRDPTTKQKALKELIDLLDPLVGEDSKPLDTSAVIAVLPFWPRIYCRLAVDENRKVRELVQMAMSRVASRVGRELGPYIKQIFPTWAFSTVDVHEPAASIASRGLNETFPGPRRLDAYRVCARQILDLVESKLTEEFGPPSSATSQPGRTGRSKEKRMVEKNCTDGLSTPDVISDASSRTENLSVLQMVACLRFINSLVEDFSALPADNSQLIRFRALLRPDNLWSTVSRYIHEHIRQQTGTDGRSLIGYSSAVHSALYRLSTALCTHPAWNTWLRETEDGKHLAAYLCSNTVARLGPADRSMNGKVHQTPCPIPAPLLVLNPGFGCYAQAWEAALACLLHLPNSFIWSIVDWRKDVCAPLEHLLRDVGAGYAKQVYPNLLSLLSQLPLNYGQLSTEDTRLLRTLFVDAALTGLERILAPRTVGSDGFTEAATSSTSHVAYADPNSSVTIVTGVLECARFLIDRITTTGSETSNSLVGDIFDNVILRLLADALHVLRHDDRTQTVLVCTQPPLVRQAYLQAVFSQIAALFANLARAVESGTKVTLFERLRGELFRWVSESPQSRDMTSTASSEPETPMDHVHLGLLDPLRLTHFVDCLAKVAIAQNLPKDSSGPSARPDRSESRPSVPNSSQSRQTAAATVVIQDSWCIDLFTQLCKRIEAQFGLGSSDPLVETCFYITYLSVSGYLPSSESARLPHLEDKLFTLMLPTLGEDLLHVFWSEAAVRGLARSWIGNAGTSNEAIRPCALSRHRFLVAILPTLVQLPSLGGANALSDRVRDLCITWTREWIQGILATKPGSSNDSLRLTDFATILSLVYGTRSSVVPTPTVIEELRELVLPSLLESLRSHLPAQNALVCSESSDFGTATLLCNMATLILVTLEEVYSHRTMQVPGAVISPIRELLVILLRLLLALYSVHYSACVTSTLDPHSELATLAASTSTETPDGSYPTHPLSGISLRELISHVEQVFLTQSSSHLDKTDQTATYYRLILHTVIHTSFVPPQLMRFVELLIQHHAERADSQTSLLVCQLWLSDLVTAMVALADGIARCEHLAADDCYPARTVLFPAGLLPVHVWPALGCLFRACQFALRLRLTSALTPVRSEQWTQYVYCLGVLRGCLASLSEPLDPCVAFGWPAQFCTLDQSVDSPYSDASHSADANLEPARSAFGQLESIIASQLGLCWFSAMADVPLATFIEMMSPTAVRRAFPQLSNAQWIAVCSVLNTVCLNRLRSIHPNHWPRELKLAASCTDDPAHPESSWFEDHARVRSERIIDLVEFNRLCEMCLPAGIVRRCLPRQELLGRLKSLTMAAATSHEDGDLDRQVEADRILQLLTSLVSVHVVSPVYVTTFLTVLTVDYQKWLTQLVDTCGESDGANSLTTNRSGLHATLAAMGFFESLLLLWQPWQWCTDVAFGKSAVVQQLGLIQLSMRLRQLRPVLTRDEWDFILCLIISWTCLAAEHTSPKPSTEVGNHSMHAVASRAFRVAAALGAVFIERVCAPIPFDSLIARTVSKSSTDMFSEATTEDWDDGLDGETIDEDAVSVDVEESPEEEQELVKARSDESAKGAEDSLLDDLNDDPSACASPQEEDDMELEEDLANDGTEADSNSWIDAQNLIPRKGRPPVQIREDWHKFFANHLYSTLLPIVFHHCLPLEPNPSGAVDITPRFVQSLCAAFATCPVYQLLRLLSDNPQLILEYLMVDLDRTSLTDPPCPNVPQLIPRRAESITELTPSLRACLDFGAKLIRCSPTQSGQLLGHILLSRLLCARTQRAGSSNQLCLSNYLLYRLPTSWLLGLYGPLPARLERDLTSERAVSDWGRGAGALAYLIQFSPSRGWFLDVRAHHQLLGYLLSWDCLLTMLTSAGAQTRASLQRALLGPSAAMFDRFLLCLGILLPPPGNLETLLATPGRLEPDERLLLPVSASRIDLIAALSLRASTRQRLRRPMRLAVSVAPGDDRDWRDPFSPDDRLLYLPGHRLASDINHMAVRLLRRFLAEAPALLRGWFTRLTTPTVAGTTEALQPENSIATMTRSSNNAPVSPLSGQRAGRLRQLASTVDKLVSRHFSPGLARDEVLLVQYKAHQRETRRADTNAAIKANWFSMFTGGPAEVGTVTIRSRPLSREVIATYQVTEEHSMEMLIQLPVNYPLGLATVSCGRGVGISQQQWHMWMVQLSVFINNQNGSILDGIDLWQKNVRKKFEGVEECAICYSIVHNTNFSLPKMQCHTCKKLFHYACMYRWFTTSRNPACPLCRHLFFGPTGRPT